ncbi:hypothetical protein BKA66DRAFT_175734 [Pyrenochaeta sp. MPI-SDFR-AT-0127]|nr:hypothetical protein BKA66DRAFT_175734 [Pyrenochaeta sp. MPI-SDFR-AT-0127]
MGCLLACQNPWPTHMTWCFLTAALPCPSRCLTRQRVLPMSLVSLDDRRRTTGAGWGGKAAQQRETTPTRSRDDAYCQTLSRYQNMLEGPHEWNLLPHNNNNNNNRGRQGFTSPQDKHMFTPPSGEQCHDDGCPSYAKLLNVARHDWVNSPHDNNVLSLAPLNRSSIAQDLQRRLDPRARAQTSQRRADRACH